jgi:hypothetical protein
MVFYTVMPYFFAENCQYILVICCKSCFCEFAAGFYASVCVNKRSLNRVNCLYFRFIISEILYFN